MQVVGFPAFIKVMLSEDGDGVICALWGDNLQEGIAGFGKNPAVAIREWKRSFIDLFFIPLKAWSVFNLICF